jgi:hypothetical protein
VRPIFRSTLFGTGLGAWLRCALCMMASCTWRRLTQGADGQALEEMLEDDERFGFIVMDGSGSLYGTVQVRASCCRRSEGHRL